MFPDGDDTEYENDCWDSEEERMIGENSSLQALGVGLGSRRRKDAIPSSVGVQRIPSNPALQPPAAPRAPSISETLKRIPLEIWESSTPVLDALIKETLRVAQPHTAMRRNMGPEFYIDGKLVPTGAYVVYPFSDVHLDEGIYKDAWKFDPGRWLDEGCDEGNKKQDGKDMSYSYVSWGGGQCLVCFPTPRIQTLIIPYSFSRVKWLSRDASRQG